MECRLGSKNLYRSVYKISNGTLAFATSLLKLGVFCEKLFKEPSAVNSGLYKATRAIQRLVERYALNF